MDFERDLNDVRWEIERRKMSVVDWREIRDEEIKRTKNGFGREIFLAFEEEHLPLRSAAVYALAPNICYTWRNEEWSPGYIKVVFTNAKSRADAIRAWRENRSRGFTFETPSQERISEVLSRFSSRNYVRNPTSLHIRHLHSSVTLSALEEAFAAARVIRHMRGRGVANASFKRPSDAVEAFWRARDLSINGVAVVVTFSYQWHLQAAADKSRHSSTEVDDTSMSPRRCLLQAMPRSISGGPFYLARSGAPSARDEGLGLARRRQRVQASRSTTAFGPAAIFSKAIRNAAEESVAASYADSPNEDDLILTGERPHKRFRAALAAPSAAGTELPRKAERRRSFVAATSRRVD